MSDLGRVAAERLTMSSLWAPGMLADRQVRNGKSLEAASREHPKQTLPSRRGSSTNANC